MTTPPPVIANPYTAGLTQPLPPEAQVRRAAVRGYILFTIGVLLALFLAWKILHELEILYIAGLFAVVLMPIVNRITRLNIRGYQPSRGAAIFGLLILIIAFLTIFFTIGLPPVLRDLENFMADLPKHIPATVAKLKKIPGADKLNLDQVAASAENYAGAVGSFLVNSIPLWLTHLFDIVTGAILCIYFMLEGETAYQFFLSLFPVGYRVRLDRTLKKADNKMSGWLVGQGSLMLILGTLSLLVFGLLHVRYFVLLGVLMGLFNLIPVAGAVISVSLALIAAALDSWTKAAGVLIFYLIYLNIENAVLTPRIMKSSVDLSGLTVLIALLLGSALAGIAGALVAVPTAALVAVLLQEYAVQNDAGA